MLITHLWVIVIYMGVLMKFLSGFFSVFLLLSSSVFAVEPLPEYSQHYDETRDPFVDAKAAIKLAKETNRQILIEVGGKWCTWCTKIDEFLVDNPEVAKALHESYVLLKVNVSDTNENAEFMKGLPPVLGYPHMYVSTSSGKMLLSKDTAELLDGENYSVKNWMSFINKWRLNATQG